MNLTATPNAATPGPRPRGISAADLPEDAAALAVAEVVAILKRWGLTSAERARVLDTTESSLRRWEQAVSRTPRSFPGKLSQDQLVRISLVLGIRNGLKIIFATEGHDEVFLRSANTSPCFDGHAPIELLLAGQDDMRRLRRYIDARRGI